MGNIIVDLNYVNLDHGNFDKVDSKTIFQIRLIA